MHNNSFTRAATLSFFVLIGFIIGALFLYSLEDDSIRFRYAVISVAVTVVAVLIAITIRKRKMTDRTEDAGRGSEVGFVVHTFQDLVAKLKEKENELERLRAFAEERATSIEAYNENILQSVPSGVVSIDNSMNIRSMNQAAERILGIDAGASAGRQFGEVFSEPLTSIATDMKTVSRMECRYIINDKRQIWLGVTSSVLRNGAGEEIGLTFVFTDLTDIKALQAQVELKQRLSQLGEMSAGISHELRNSMSVISGYAKLLARKAAPEIRPAVDSILSEIGNMDRIISELLVFAKPSVLNTELIELNRLLRETVTNAVAEREDIKVSFKTEQSVSLKADEVLLRQALSNILVNAVEAMPDGGLIEVKTVSRDDRVEIRIKDTGEGIPEEIKQKIFLPFFTTKDGGTGFGLALVQKIIVAHGGNIEIESSQGHDTTFLLSMPKQV